MSLPSFVTDSCWFPLDEPSGTTVTDRINGHTGEIVGTNGIGSGWLTLGADTAVKCTGDAFDELMRLDNLEGSLLVSLQIQNVGTPSAQSHLWGYGDNGDNTYGGYSQTMGTTFFHSSVFAQRGGALKYQQSANNLCAMMKTSTTRYYQMALHRFDGYIYADGYVEGFQSRSTRYPVIEGYEPGVFSTAGLRIGARPLAAGGSANYVGATMTNPKINNFIALRIDGDYRHRIPGIMRDIAKSVPRGGKPKILRGIY